MPIRLLPPDAINRIAAGEVIERPAAAAKELVENSLDAGARNVRVRASEGGLAYLSVEDDGHGMGPEDLALAIERHATSKLAPDSDGRLDLLNIHTLGFRGEALPSIGAVARLRLVSRMVGGLAHSLTVEAGQHAGSSPAAWDGFAAHGTRVEVEALFSATPARLKFMKSARAEALALSETVRRLAMARADVGFHLDLEGKSALRLSAETPDATGRLRRLEALMGREFAANALPIETSREGVELVGFAGLPTLNRGNASHQFLFVNGRPVRDRLLSGVVRAAYQDFLASDRHPMLALFLNLEAEQVDVNVHPAKTEVRFRDPALVRGLMIGALRHALAGAGHRASTTIATAALGALRAPDTDRPSPPGAMVGAAQLGLMGTGAPPWSNTALSGFGRAAPPPGFADPAAPGFQTLADRGLPSDQAYPAEDALDLPLGVARAQLHGTYIVSQTRHGMVLVDQHAAHERLVYERMKAAFDAPDGLARQPLLVPEVVELAEDESERLIGCSEDLAAFGLEIEGFGRGAVLVRAVPALLPRLDLKGLCRDLADEIAELGQGLKLKERLDAVLGDMACRSSVRAGRVLAVQEMNALLRQMEATPHSGQCNHGRPTYVELKLTDIERLFGRS